MLQRSRPVGACCIIFAVICNLLKVGGVPFGDFFPFGIIAGDQSLPPIDDGCDQVVLTQSFPFAGKNSTELYVNTNGYISLGAPIVAFFPQVFPLYNSLLIAPFWADVDTRGNGGTVWYSSAVSELMVLNRTKTLIESVFSNQVVFSPEYVFIATWDHVGYFDGHTEKTNTFQCVLATDLISSFAIFLYANGEIQWTTGDSAGGENGLGGIPAQVGINTGDKINSVTVPESLTPEIINISTTSNVEIPGLWIFQVDQQPEAPQGSGGDETDIEVTGFNIVIGFAQPSYTVREDGGNISVCLDVDAVEQQTGVITVQIISVDATAIAMDDFMPVSRNLTVEFTEGVPIQEFITISIIADGVVENAERFRVEIINSDSAVLVTIPSTTVVITDCTVVHLGFVMPSFTVNESETSVSVCARAQGAQGAQGELARDVVVKVSTASGGTSDPFDFSSLTTSVTFSGTSPLRCVNITIIEGTEDFNITLATGDTAVNLTSASAIVVIRDTSDDRAELGAASCNSSDRARRLCQISRMSSAVAAESLKEITANVTELQPVEITIAVTILEQLTEDAATNPNVTDNYLDVIDQLLDTNPSHILESHENSRSSSRLLSSLQDFAAAIPINDNNTFVRDNFALQVHEIEAIDESQPRVFVANLGDINLVAGSRITDGDLLTFDEVSDIEGQPTAYTSLPQSLFVPDNDTVLRVHYTVFLTDVLFQLRSMSERFETGSIIVSVRVGSGPPPENITAEFFFQTREVARVNTTCVFWDFDEDGGFGAWSTRGCFLREETEKNATCECDHLTNFGILLDLTPRATTDTPPEQQSLEIISLIGIVISIVVLIVTIFTYLISRKLRSGIHGQMLMNSCTALLGFYLLFVAASLKSRIPLPNVVCGIFSALLHYFMLVYFCWTAAESLLLYLKLVKVFGIDTTHFVLKAAIVSWILPAFFVGLLVAPTSSFYISRELLCFPDYIPFYIGVVAPFAVIYIFNFIMFVMIMHSISCRHTTRKDGASKTEFRKNAMIALILAVTFGLGWIFGLLGTSSLRSVVRLPSVYLFTILVGTQGLLTFVLRVLRSPDVRNEWKKWFYALTCRMDSYIQSSHRKPTLRHVQASSSDTLRRERHLMSTSSTLPRSTTLTSESSDTLHSHGRYSDTLHTAIQHRLESVTEEVDATIEEPPAIIPQVRKLTVIENRQIADDLDLHESGTSALFTSQPQPSVPLSPALTLSGQQLQPIRQRTVVFENTQVDCGEDSPNNTDNAVSWSERIEEDAKVTETVFFNFSAETFGQQ